MSFPVTPNKLEAVFIQRNSGNTHYDQINISGSDLIVYLDSVGKINADKISVWAANYGLGGSGTSLTTGSTYPITSSWAVSASWSPSNSSISASYASTASYAQNSQTASYYGGTIVSASYATTSSYVKNAASSSYATIANSGVVGFSVGNLQLLSGEIDFYFSKVMDANGIYDSYTTAKSINYSDRTLNNLAGAEVLNYYSSPLTIKTSTYISNSGLIVDKTIVAQSVTASLHGTASALIDHIKGNATISNANTASILHSINTGSYNSVFYDYVAISASNSRCGTLFGNWISNQFSYSEVSTTDIGNTSPLSMSLNLIGNIIYLSGSASTIPWNIKLIGRFL